MLLFPVLTRPESVSCFTCVRATVGGRVQADALQVTVAALFMLLQGRALLIAPSTVITLVWFAN